MKFLSTQFLRRINFGQLWAFAKRFEPLEKLLISPVNALGRENLRINESLGYKRVTSTGNGLQHGHAEELVVGRGHDHVRGPQHVPVLVPVLQVAPVQDLAT